MASSREAFDKFLMWKNSRTVLKLTVLTNDGNPPTKLRVEVVSVIEDELGVGFLTTGREAFALDFSGASFEIGKLVLKAEKTSGEVFKFDEV